MLEFIHEGGPFMILLVIIMIGLLILSVKKFYDLYINKNQIDRQNESGINAILFWGSISALLGVLGQLSGLYLSISAIAMATDISPKIVLMGLKISFNSTLFGLWILFFSSIIWFALRARYKKLIAK